MVNFYHLVEMSKKKRISDQIIEDIEKGIKGLNMGLPTGLPKLDGIIYGIQKSTYYVFGGDTSSGKSSLANQIALFEPYEYSLQHPEKVRVEYIYFSFEMQARKQFLRGLSREIYKKEKRVFSNEYLLSRKGKLSEESYKKVKEYLPYFDKLEDHIAFYEVSLTPLQVEKIIRYQLSKYGEFLVDEDESEYYVLKEEFKNLHFIVIFDHASLTKSEANGDGKIKMDKVSKILIKYRNMCEISPVILQQFNRGLRSMERKRFDSQEPTLDDFSGSADIGQDADVVIAIAYPITYGVDTYRGYLITPQAGGFGNRFRMLHVLKNRDGEPNVNLGICFFGEVGMWINLPKAEEFTSAQDYTQYLKP